MGAGIGAGLVVIASENKNRHRREARDQFRDEGGTTETGSVESDHYQGKAICEFPLFHKNEGFGDVGCPLHIVEVAPEKRRAYECLKRVVVDQ
jgi:hypothetical protein